MKVLLGLGKQGQIVLATNVTQDANDVTQYAPMVEAILASAPQAGINASIGCVLADAGYLAEDNLTAPGPQRLIATTKAHELKRRADAEGPREGPPPEGVTPVEAMTHLLITPKGRATYAKRQHTVGRSSARSRRTGGTGASCDEAWPEPTPSGSCWRSPTTS